MATGLIPQRRQIRSCLTGHGLRPLISGGDQHHAERHWAGTADALLFRTTLRSITTPRRGTIRDRNLPRMACRPSPLLRIRAGRRWVRRRSAAWLEQDLERELRRAAATQHVASLPEIGVGGGELCRFGLVEA
jgi:hypothetical protein